jgi:hypothetical protein
MGPLLIFALPAIPTTTLRFAMSILRERRKGNPDAGDASFQRRGLRQ